ncbi:MAG: HesA/MoeB/ThiF family protein [Candidatus Binatia bacterium]
MKGGVPRQQAIRNTGAKDPSSDQGEKNTVLDERLDRQVRIEGWDQRVLDKAKIGLVGDDDLLVSLYTMSASALGLNTMIVVAPRLDDTLLETARKVNPALNISLMEGFYTHPVMDDIFTGCNAVVDLSQYGLANKLLLEKGFRETIPIVRGFCYEEDGEQGFKIFTYMRGREWDELEQVVSPQNLPGDHFDDGVLDIIASGIALEETKNILMGQRVSEDVITYKRTRLAAARHDPNICVVGAGALGNFVGLGLAYSGFRRITFIDPDVVEITNLNRQVFLADAIGLGKAAALSQRLNDSFGIEVQPRVAYFRADTNISPYDVIFDCVDNFETEILLSEKCQAHNKVLISGGTSENAGQVIVYDPTQRARTPAELLGLYDIVGERKIETYERVRASCAYRPDPSVIMANQIIAGFMVDSYRMLLDGQKAANIFYDSTSDKKILVES